MINSMKFYQNEISLKAFPRGFHIITNEITDSIAEIKNNKVGMLQVFIKHTSASLAINENADPTVRIDFENQLNKIV